MQFATSSKYRVDFWEIPPVHRSDHLHFLRQLIAGLLHEAGQHHVAVCCSVLQCGARWRSFTWLCCSVLQRVAACCSALLCVTVCCSVVLDCALFHYHVAVCCGALRCIAVWCSVLQGSAPGFHMKQVIIMVQCVSMRRQCVTVWCKVVLQTLHAPCQISQRSSNDNFVLNSRLKMATELTFSYQHSK